MVIRYNIRGRFSRVRRLFTVKSFVGCFLIWALAVLLGALGAVIGLDSTVGMLVLVFASSVGSLAVLLFAEIRIARLVERTFRSTSEGIRAATVRGHFGVRSYPGSDERHSSMRDQYLTGSQYSPAFCPTTESPSRGGDEAERVISGRGDAAVQSDGSSDLKMAALLARKTKRPDKPELTLIGCETEERWLALKTSVTRASPGMHQVELSPSAGYLVISSSANEKGPWAGVFDSSNFALFDQLRRATAKAKENGSVVVVLDISDRSVSHFDGSIRALADVVLTPGMEDDFSGIGGGNRTLHHLLELVEKEG